MVKEIIETIKELMRNRKQFLKDVYSVKSWFDDYVKSGNLVPPKDDNYDLGSKDRQWKKIYGGTVIVNQVSAMDDILGTIDVMKTVQTPRSASYNTLDSAFPCDGANQVPGTADVRTLDGFSLGIDVDGTVEVSHQIQTVPGGSWREDGVGTLVTNEERISTINHKGLQYRPSLTNMDASSTVSVNIEWMGN